MWVRRAAIRPVPSWARVVGRVLAEVEEELAGDESSELDAAEPSAADASGKLDRSFSRFEDTQPVLAERVNKTLSRPLDETALALGYFLSLAVWLAFDRTFAGDLEPVSETALEGVEQSLTLDEEIRKSDAAEAVDSDDVIAMEQPEVIEFVHEHLEAALEANADEVKVDDVHEVYRMVLVEILALSYAVRAPKSFAATSSEFTA